MAKQQDELIKVVPVRLSELWRKGLAVYERLKEQLEREHWGKYVVIEPESGDYEVAPTRTEALLRMRQRHPDKVFVSRRIGFLDKKVTMTVEGHIDEALQIRLPVQVWGQRGVAELNAIVDTGFNGALSLPVSVAVTLGLLLTDLDIVELADGRTQPELIFEGWAQIGEAPEQLVDILLTFSEEALVGMALLNLLNADLQVRLSQRTVTLTLPETPNA